MRKKLAWNVSGNIEGIHSLLHTYCTFFDVSYITDLCLVNNNLCLSPSFSLQKYNTLNLNVCLKIGPCAKGCLEENIDYLRSIFLCFFNHIVQWKPHTITALVCYWSVQDYEILNKLHIHQYSFKSIKKFYHPYDLFQN